MNVILYSLVPDSALRLLAPAVLVLVGIIVETRFVGRIAMFTNAAALYVFYHPINMSQNLGLLINSAIIIGIIAGIARFTRTKLPAAFYKIGWVVSSLVTAGLLLYGLSL